jgi:putative DNA primase/helicase
VILTNELPRLIDSSGALAGRFLVWTMDVSFYGREKPGLTDELCTELPGIFNWALDGLQRLRARGRFAQPQSSEDAIRQLEDLGSPVGAFVRDRCALGGDRVVPCDELYQAWRSWCDDNGRHRTNTQVFGRDLRATRPELQVRQLGGDRKRHYAGIGLRDDSRDSRVNEHCGAHDRDAGAAQRIYTRESRECARCAGEGCSWCEP